MKMTSETYNFIKERFNNHREEICNHMHTVKQSGKFNVLEHRVGWDTLQAVLPKGYVSNHLYGVENLEDRHIETALRSIFKELDIKPVDLHQK